MWLGASDWCAKNVASPLSAAIPMPFCGAKYFFAKDTEAMDIVFAFPIYPSELYNRSKPWFRRCGQSLFEDKRILTRRSLMNLTRRQVLVAIGALANPARARAAGPQLEIAAGPFRGTRESLEDYRMPAWYRNAKLGIRAHWGPQSAAEAGDWYARNMYIQASGNTITMLKPTAIRRNSDSRV
jgi:hypothetical protein